MPDPSPEKSIFDELGLVDVEMPKEGLAKKPAQVEEKKPPHQQTLLERFRAMQEARAKRREEGGYYDGLIISSKQRKPEDFLEDKERKPRRRKPRKGGPADAGEFMYQGDPYVMFVFSDEDERVLVEDRGDLVKQFTVKIERGRHYFTKNVHMTGDEVHFFEQSAILHKMLYDVWREFRLLDTHASPAEIIEAISQIEEIYKEFDKLEESILGSDVSLHKTTAKGGAWRAGSKEQAGREKENFGWYIRHYPKFEGFGTIGNAIKQASGAEGKEALRAKQEKRQKRVEETAKAVEEDEDFEAILRRIIEADRTKEG